MAKTLYQVGQEAVEAGVQNTSRFGENAWFVEHSTAITGNTTTTSAPAGSLGITSNATGRDQLFISDGSKWQTLATYSP